MRYTHIGYEQTRQTAEALSRALERRGEFPSQDCVSSGGVFEAAESEQMVALSARVLFSKNKK